MKYEDIEALNHSTLKLHFKSPAHVKHYLENGRKETAEMARGTLLHLAILEPHKLSDVMVYDKLDGRTKEGRTQREELEEARESGVLTAPRAELERVSEMAQSVFAHSDANKIVKAVSECEKILQGELLGIKCKGLADFYSEKGQFLGDLKTTSKDPRFFSFQREAANFHYYTQAAFYLLLCKAMNIKADAFFWIVVESEPPYGVCVYPLSEVTRSTCDLAIEALLERHKACEATDYWPCYSEPMQPLDAPDYYFSKLEALR